MFEGDVMTLIPVLAWMMILTNGTSAPQVRADTFANDCRHAIWLEEGRETTPLETLRATQCMSYLVGFLEGHRTAMDHAEGDRLCVPPGVNAYQFARVIVQASDERPEIGHYPRRSLVEYALNSKWSCADPQGS